MKIRFFFLFLIVCFINLQTKGAYYENPNDPDYQTELNEIKKQLKTKYSEIDVDRLVDGLVNRFSCTENCCNLSECITYCLDWDEGEAFSLGMCLWDCETPICIIKCLLAASVSYELEYIECINDCVIDPCKYSPSSTQEPCAEGKWCKQSKTINFSSGGTTNWSFNTECEPCPIIEFDVNTFSIDLNTSSISTPLYTTSYGSPQIGVTLYQGNEILDNWITDENFSLDISEFNPQIGDEFCLSYEGISNSQLSTIDCSDNLCITVECLPEYQMQIEEVNYHNESSPGASNGGVGLSILEDGGNPGDPTTIWTIIWNTIPPQYGFTLSNVEKGTYCADISNDNGCSTVYCVEIGSDVEDCVEDDSEDRSNSNVARSSLGCTLSLSASSQDESSPGANDGSINISINGGNAPYYIYWSDIQGLSSELFRENLAPGEYCIDVLTYNDLSGLCCQASKCITIGDACQYVDIKLPKIPVTQPSACITADGAIQIPTLLITGGTPPYGVQWNNGINSPNIANLEAGIYSATVTDANGCSTSTSVELTPLESIGLTSSTVAPSFGNCDGSIQVSIQNGSPAYTVTVRENGNDIFSYTGNSNTYSFPGLCASTYQIIVQDDNECQEDIFVELGYCSPIFIEDPIITPSTGCQNSSGPVTNGSIDFGQAEPFTGTPPFTYAWDNGASTLSVTDLGVGEHTLTITDANGCSSEFTYMINTETSNGLSFTLDIIDIQHDMENNCTGSITVHVFNNHSAVSILYVEITPGTGPPIVLTRENFLIDEEVTFSGLCGDDYTIVVYTEEGIPANQVCTLEATASVMSCPGFSMASPPQIIRPSGCGEEDGSITYGEFFNPYGGTAPYTWLWSNGSMEEYSIGNLSPGNYSLTVVDANGCKIEKTFDLSVPNDPALVNYTILQQPSGENECDGSISFQGPSGVSVIFTYPNGQLELYNLTGNTIYLINDLCIGDYTLTVGVHSSCAVVYEITLDGCSEITLGTMDIDPPSNCNSSDGVIRFLTQPSGGTPGTPPAPSYTYTLVDEDGIEFSYNPQYGSFSSLPSNMYTLTVHDANDCTEDFEINLLGAGDPQLEYSFVIPECEDFFNGEIGIFVTSGNGGNSTFTYELIPYPPTTQEDIDGLAAQYTGLETGNYEVVVTSDVGCSLTLPFFVDEIPSMGPFQLSNTPTTEPSCPYQGQESGSITFTLEGGNKPYKVKLVGNALKTSDSEPTQPTDITFTDLGPGTYCTEYIKDDCGRTIPNTCVTVGAYPVMTLSSSVTVDCPGASKVDLMVNGGDGPFTYNWSGPGFNASSQDINGLYEGNYSVTVTDIHGCFQTHSVFVGVIDPPSVNVSVIINVACQDFNIGQINLNGGISGISGGKPPYTNVHWTNQSGGTVGGGSLFIENLAPGTYTLNVTDGCGTFTFPYTIANGSIDEFDVLNSCYSIIECSGNGQSHEVGIKTYNSNGYQITYDNSEACKATIGCENGQTINIEGQEILDHYEGGGTSNVNNCFCFKTYECRIQGSYQDQATYVDVNGVPHTMNYSIPYSAPSNVITEDVSNDPNEVTIVPGNIQGAGGCKIFEFQNQYFCGNLPAAVCEYCVPIPDMDGDNVPDDEDNCPNLYNPGVQQDLECDQNEEYFWIYYCDTDLSDEDNDRDGDGILDVCDNCVPTLESHVPADFYNPAQTDADEDGIGDICDEDTVDLDEDGVDDSIDNCVGGIGQASSTFNPNQYDCDGDGIGDVCDDDYSINCPNAPTIPVALTSPSGTNLFSENRSPEIATRAKAKLYPNPVKNDFTIEYHSVETEEQLTINLYNVIGNFLQMDARTVVKGENTLKFRLNDKLPNGVYRVEILGKDKTPILFNLVKLDR